MENMILNYDNICRNKSHFYLNYEHMKENAFIERLSTNFESDEPIFTEEIIKLFPDCSRAQIFRYIDKAKQKEEIVQYSRGVYFIPHITYFGTLSTITIDQVLDKRYIRNKDNVYGVYSGLGLLNFFSITTQMPAVIEMVSNNESTRCRRISVKTRRFVLKKSRCEITSKNYAAYTILQLFNDFDDEDRIYGSSERRLLGYIEKHKVTKSDVLSVMPYFPKKALDNFARSNIIDVLA